MILLHDILSIGALAVGGAVCVAGEAALIKARKTVLEEQRSGFCFGRSIALSLLVRSEQNILCLQLLIISFGAAFVWWGSCFISKLIPDFFGIDPALIALNPAVHGELILLSLLLTIFIFGVTVWLIPKSLGAIFPEKTLCFWALPLYLLTSVVRPLIWLMVKTSDLVLRVGGHKTEVEVSRVHSSEEIAELVSQSTEVGELDKDEEEMLHGVIGFSDTVAREVMTPRTDLVTVPINSSLVETIAIVVDSGFSRLPVVSGSVDNVQGVLLVKDLVPYLAKVSSNGSKAAEFSVSKIMREPYFIPGTKPVDELLAEFRTRKVHLAIVLDEHGGVDGAVSLEDLLEEIVGDIFDESDVPENEVTREESGELVVDGGVLVCDLNSQFDLSIPEGEYDTIAGFVFSATGKVPSVGDKVELEGARIVFVTGSDTSETEMEGGYLERAEEERAELSAKRVSIIVEDVDGYRIDKVRIRVIESVEGEDTSDV